MPGLLEQLDGAISDLFQGWNAYSTVLLVGILGFVGWVLANNADADTHPLLLARQAQASYVRQPGESAVFRSPETPHGCRCLRTPVYNNAQLTLLRSSPHWTCCQASGRSHVLCWQRW